VPPLVKLSDEYKLVDQFEALIAGGIPSLIGCKSLTLEGKLAFDREVEIVGDVKFVAGGLEPKRIKPGSYKDTEILL
jgi:UTP--glucose-1-phosphate uridylyltransferase